MTTQSFEPRQTDFHAWIRWTVQGFQLMTRNAVLWTCLACAFIALALTLRNSRMIVTFLIGTFFFTGIGVAAYTDSSRKVPIGPFLGGTLKELSSAAKFSAFCVAVVGLFWSQDLGSIRNFVWSTGPVSSDLRSGGPGSLYWAAVLVLVGLNMFVGVWTYPLRRFGVSTWHAWWLNNDGALLNFTSYGAIFVLFSMLHGMAFMLVTPLFPVIMCWCSCTIYVSFRDVFLGISENKALELEPQGAVLAARSHS